MFIYGQAPARGRWTPDQFRPCPPAGEKYCGAENCRNTYSSASPHRVCSTCRRLGIPAKKRQVECHFCGKIFHVDSRKTGQKYCGRDCARGARLKQQRAEHARWKKKLAHAQRARIKCNPEQKTER